MATIRILFAAALLAAGCTPVRDVGVADLAPSSREIPAVEVPAFTLYFDPGSTALTIDGAAVLAQVVDGFRRTAFDRVRVAGYADRAGPGRRNAALSRARAEAVRDHLVGAGLPPTAIATEAYGEGRTMVGTADGSPEAQNRRVEIFVD